MLRTGAHRIHKHATVGLDTVDGWWDANLVMALLAMLR